MKVYENEFYAKVTYNLESETWRRTTAIEFSYNGKICSVDFYMKDVSPVYTQIKFEIKD